MTPLSLDAPLASLLDIRRADGRPLSQRHLGELRQPIVTQGSVGAALAAGGGIKLATLDAYARAAGYRLVVAVEPL